ncbi:MAG TPA: hypothetical protein DFI01_03545, partial [Bacteroidales bacterium]|nr:hypothetical protein [Bacteroidales bacterium]
MKKYFLIFCFFLVNFSLFAQPSEFTWSYRHKIQNYISPAKNQREQGPCGAFAVVGAVEAIAQIYFNKTWPMLDLSESNIYSNNDTSCHCPGVGCGSIGVVAPLNLIKSTGIVDEDCLKYPDEPLKPEEEPNRYCYEYCQGIICDNPAYRVFIPYWEKIYITNNTLLKQAIMDYGPIIVTLQGTGIGCRLHPDDPDCEITNDHTVLFIGWETENNIFKWRFKDCWPSKPGDTPRHDIFSDSINIFCWKPDFYRVYPVYSDSTIHCTGSDCSLFNSRSYVDNDKDGFYNWGFDTQPKPSGCPGPDKMDFDDGEPLIIFRSGYTPLRTPFITGPSGIICTSGATFTLDSVPPGFSVSWSVYPMSYFNPPYSGSGNSATVYPNLERPGYKCTITFTINHNGTASYSKDFIIVGPREDLVSMSVLDSDGGSVPYDGYVYYLCPNTNYHIYYNNSDYGCSTWDYDWVLPYGWTENWRYNDMISINTNDYPYGQLEVWAKTCCENQSRIKVKSQWFFGGECEGYFMAYPNPAANYVDIDINRTKMTAANLSTDVGGTLTIYDKTGVV